MNKQIKFSLIVAGLMLGSAAVLKFANFLDLIDQETVKRGAQVTIGLMLAAYANVMPKSMTGAIGSAEATRRAQSVLRLGGWLLTLAGVGYAAAWAFAPIRFADPVATTIVAGATVTVMAYGGWTLLACRRARQAPLSV